MRSRLRQWLELQPPDHFLLIEPEEELRRIVAAEIGQAVTFPVQSCNLHDCPKTLDGAIPVVLPNRAAAVRQALPEGTDVLTLHFRSVPTSLAGWLPAPSGTLIGIASGMAGFLETGAHHAECRGLSPGRPGISGRAQSELAARAAADSGRRLRFRYSNRTAFSRRSNAGQFQTRVLPISLSESSIAELRRYVEFITRPIESL